MAPRILIMSLAIVLGGCFSTSMAADKHADFYHCDSSQVTAEDLPASGHTQVKTIGCGHEETFYCIGAKCRSPHILAIREFAGTHGCTNEQTTATSEGSDVWVASGCGKTQKYRCTEVQNDVIHCTPTQ